MSGAVQIGDATERRRQLRARAGDLGIDEAYVATLVDTFYANVRAHALLGPIFEDAIGDDWDGHLATMKDFWASLALGAGRYDGRPVPAHAKHTMIRPWHFGIWLALFEQTLRATSPTPEAAAFFMERARQIAQSLQLALFGAPRPGPPPS